MFFLLAFFVVCGFSFFSSCFSFYSSLLLSLSLAVLAVFVIAFVQVWENATAPHAYLSMELAQDVDSYEKIKEIDPLEIAEIFGSVGGFWGKPESN